MSVVQKSVGCWFFVAGLALGASAAVGATLDNVKARGTMNCGVYPNFPGFSTLGSDGKYVGFDIDFCNAVAAAVNVNVKHAPLSATERFPALQSKTVDMLSMVTTWTASRDIANALQFTVITFHDGQGFTTRKKNNVARAKDLAGATICVLQGTTSELNLTDWSRANNIKISSVTFSTEDELLRAYEAGRCDAFTGAIAIMAGRRTNFKTPSDHVILPDVISKEPLTPVTAEGDQKWSDIVSWTIYATIIAEEKGITSKNVDEAVKSSTDPEVKRLFGETGSMGQDLGLDAKWAVRVIKTVGNYGEIFDRHLGTRTPLGLDRGLNALWNRGGLIYAPPYR